MRILILDDDQTRQETFAARYASHDRTHVYNAQEAIAELDGPMFDAVLLDHDLGEYNECGDGMDVVHALKALPGEKRPLTVVVHSWNGPRARIMVETLRNHGYSAHYKPFAG